MSIKKFFNSLLVGLLLAVSLISPSFAATTTSKVVPKPASASLYYVNSSGVKVKRPVAVKEVIPVGATAQCRDATFSFSQHRRGACSHHGGVKKWL